jgi:hypothetical protein
VIGTVQSNRKTVWNPENIELLKRLWSEGLSATQIAMQIPRATRNGVIGKKHRLGLENRKQAPSQNPIRIKAKKERSMPEFKPAPLPPPPEPPKGDLIPFMKAGATTCRSVEGYGEDSKGRKLAMFCPNPKDFEASFCAYHQNIYYRKDAR